MLTYNKNFQAMDKKYEDMVQEYYEFKANPIQERKDILLKKLKEFNLLKNKFKSSIDNAIVKKQKEEKEMIRIEM